MTNFERIKNMTVEEMAKLLPSCAYCAYNFCDGVYKKEGCWEGRRIWLNQEATE